MRCFPDSFVVMAILSLSACGEPTPDTNAHTAALRAGHADAEDAPHDDAPHDDEEASDVDATSEPDRARTGRRLRPPEGPTECGTLRSEQGLGRGDSLASCSARFTLTLQRDGDLVLSDESVCALWSSQTAGTGARWLVMDADGVLRLYDAHGRTVWKSQPYGLAGSYARLQDSGNFAVYDSLGRAMWHTNTAQPAAATP